MDHDRDATQDELPRLRRTPIIRPRLIGRLLERFERRVVCIVADAGYGKTTLLVQAVDENRLEPAGVDRYVTCPVYHRGATPLVGALAHAFGVDTERDAIVEAVVDQVEADAPSQVALMIDDLHHARGGDGDLLTELLHALPENGHLVVASRAAPQLPLSRLEVLDEVVHLGAEDLAFTPDETDEFAQLRGTDTSRLRDLRGWPALAELASTSDASVVGDFLWEEVADQLPALPLELLTALVVLGPSPPDVLAAALEREIVESDLAELPLVSTYGGRLEAHGLWESALSQVFDDQRRAELLARAAEAYRASGRMGDAIRTHQRAEQWEQAVALGAASATGTDWAELPLLPFQELLDALPADFRERPEVALISGLVRRGRDPGDTKAVDELERAAAGYRVRGEFDAEAATLAHLAYVYRVNVDPVGGARVQTRVEELADAGVPLAATLATVGRADASFRAGRPREALELVRSLGPDALPSEWRVTTLWLEGMSLWALGAPAEGIDPARELSRLSTPMMPGAQALEPLLRWFSGDLDGALAAAEQLHALPDLFERDRSANALIHAVMASIAGDGPRTQAQLRELELTSGSMADPLVSGQAELVRALLAHNLGDDDAAAATLQGLVAFAPMTEPVIEQIARYGFGSMYLLVPEARAHWDDATLEGTWARAHAWCRAIHACRSGTHEPMATVELGDSPGRIVAHLGVAAATELAARLEEVGRSEEARRLAAALGALVPAARAALRRLAADASPVARAADRLLAEVPEPPRHHLEVGVLGPVHVRIDGELSDSVDLRRSKVQALIGWLVTRPRSTAAAATAALWPDAEPDKGAHSLRVTLGQLRHVLEPDREPGEASWYVRRDGPALFLEPSGHLRVDAWTFDRLVDEAHEDDRSGVPSRALERYLDALGYYRGPFLDGAPLDDWVALERDRLQVRYVHASNRAADLLLATGHNDRALRLALGALAVEPWSEPAHRAAMQAHLAAGDRAAARRALERCLAALDELGVEPERPTRVLANLVRNT